jgi:hypothetical protein
VGTVDGTDFCLQTTELLNAATAPDGACAACTAQQPGACAAACPACVNALSFYLSSCDGVAADIAAAEYASYGSLMAFIDRLAPTSDCHAYFNAAARRYAASECSTAFDHVATWSQSALSTAVVLDEATGVMSVPYACLAADAGACPAECQADLELLRATCHNEDVIAWAGNGLPGYLSSVGAPAGTAVSSADAWALFVNGTAPVPANLAAGVRTAAPLALQLSACSLPVDGGGRFAAYSPPPPNPPPPPPVRTRRRHERVAAMQRN